MGLKVFIWQIINIVLIIFLIVWLVRYFYKKKKM
jgi:hypothetical protein